MADTNRGKRAAKNVMSLLVYQIVTVICGFIAPVLIIRSYGSATNGLINTITQYLAYVVLLESGFGPVVKAALYRPIAEKSREEIEKILKAAEKFFRLIALIFVVYVVALVAILPASFLEDFDWLYTASLIVIIAMATFAEYFFGMTYRLFLQAEQKTYVPMLIKTFATILSTVLIVVLINMNFSIQIVKLASTVAFALAPVAQNLYVKKKYNFKHDKTIPKYEIKQRWDGLAQHIAATIHDNTDIIVLSIFVGVKEVSVYAVYMLVLKGIKNIIRAVNTGVEASFGDMMAHKEKDNLREKFSAYETTFMAIVTIVYACAIALTVPFVEVYTRGVDDVNYIRPLFAVLIVTAEFIWALRLPYASLAHTAGHFKETKPGAWLEAIINVAVSLTLVVVFDMGMVGVAIGTLAAMFVRMIDFMLHSSRFVLERPLGDGLKRILTAAVITVAICLIANLIPITKMTSYGDWFLRALIILAVSVVITVPVILVAYHKDIKILLTMTKKVLKVERRKREKR